MLPGAEQAAQWFSSPQFEHILIRCPRLGTEPERIARSAKPLLVQGGGLMLLSSPPRLGERISRILLEECAAPPEFAAALGLAEDAFFAGASGDESGGDSALLGWDGESLQAAFEAQGFSASHEYLDQREERLIGEKDLSAWFDREHSRWGAFMGKNLDPEAFSTAEDLLRGRIKKGPLVWRWKSVLLRAISRETQKK